MDEMLSFRMAATEAALLRRAAAEAGLSVSAYVRRSLYREVRRPVVWFAPSSAVRVTGSNTTCTSGNFSWTA